MADSEDIKRLIAAMHEGGGSRAEAFFLAHGLDAAFGSVGSGYGIIKHVNAALGRARQQGRLNEDRYGWTSRVRIGRRNTAEINNENGTSGDSC